VAYDIYRYVMAGQLDPLGKLVSKDLINHNPNEASGFDGLMEYIKQFIGSEPRPVNDTLKGLVSMFAEGDMVVMSFVRDYDNPNKPGEKYTTTWFDMFRIVDGLMVEHWDGAKLKTNQE
jgi:predicted SnoaL-like aldol condensation-catalyzing enzyme